MPLFYADLVPGSGTYLYQETLSSLSLGVCGLILGSSKYSFIEILSVLPDLSREEEEIGCDLMIFDDN